jgi:N-acetylglucosamine kinase-like BadF-type ATPase
MADLFLGVDGGQSSTTALIGDSAGNILGAGKGGPCNHVGVAEGPAKLRRTVLDCLGQACDQAGLDIEGVSFSAACFGMSGGPADKEKLLAEIIRTPKLIVTNDAAIALSGAFAGGPGVVTIAGTGSIALGRAASGRLARSGGWGYVFGDEGGAFDIVRQALRAALRYEEGWGPATNLRTSLLRETGASDANELLHWFYTTDWPRARVAAIAPLVSQAAEGGDLVAVEVITHAARQLASFALAVRSQLSQSLESVQFSFIGGVFQSKALLHAFQTAIETNEGCHMAPPLLGAAAGALLDAYRAAGISPKLDKLVTSNF